MTLSSTSMRISYAGNGATTVFSFPYTFLTDADLTVYLRDATGVETLKTLTTHYTVIGAGVPGGGTVTLASIPATGETVVIIRAPAITQTTDYVDGSAFNAVTSETALDKRTMVEQRLNDQASRALKLHETDTVGSGTYDAGSQRISSLGTGTQSTDAITKAQLDALSLVGPQGPQGPSGSALLTVEDNLLVGGCNVTSKSLTTGNVTIDCGARPLQYITNGGAFTITAPVLDGSCILKITNNSSAGLVTFAGFTVGSFIGADMDTLSGNKFSVFIWRINSIAAYFIFPHQ